MNKLYALHIFLIFITSSINVFSQNCFVSTIAGNGTNDIVNGNGLMASFHLPMDLAVDSIGNVYVSDYDNKVIRKITIAGDVTTFVGTPGLPGAYLDGLGADARFNSPKGLATDALGNVYVADISNDRIRKITPSGMVSTLAGNGLSGTIDGTGVSAQIGTPDDLTFDGLGNIYVSQATEAIRKITPFDVVTTVLGDFYFVNPVISVAVDANGTIYWIEQGSHSIRKMALNTITTFVGNEAVSGDVDGQGTAARFFIPNDLAIDNLGNIYVADVGNNKIRKVTPQGLVTTLAGSGQVGDTDGNGASARFSSPNGIAIDAFGDVYVADRGNNKIRKIEICSNSTTSIISNSNGTLTSSVALSYQWIDCNNSNSIISGAIDQTYFLTANGNYAVITHYENGCIDTSDCFLVSNLELFDLFENTLTISPNPSNMFVSIQFNASRANLIIRDVHGKFITKKEIISGESVSLEDYTNGIYLFEIFTEEGTIIKKVLKQ
jgi:sugar lactone lactonase YvrE